MKSVNMVGAAIFMTGLLAFQNCSNTLDFQRASVASGIEKLDPFVAGSDWETRPSTAYPVEIGSYHVESIGFDARCEPPRACPDVLPRTISTLIRFQFLSENHVRMRSHCLTMYGRFDLAGIVQNELKIAYTEEQDFIARTQADTCEAVDQANIVEASNILKDSSSLNVAQAPNRLILRAGNRFLVLVRDVKL